MSKIPTLLMLMTVLIYLISFIESNKFTVKCRHEGKKYSCWGITSESVETECTECNVMFGYKETGYRLTTESAGITNFTSD